MSDIYGSLIDGEWNKSGIQTPNINPSDVSETLGHMVSATASQVRLNRLGKPLN